MQYRNDSGIAGAEISCQMPDICSAPSSAALPEGEGVKRSVRRGYTCCGPACYDNTEKNMELSCHEYPWEN